MVEDLKVVYIAGPYRGNIFKRIINIYRARKEAKKWWKKGYAVICPHLNSAFFDRCAPRENFLNGYLKILDFCDIVVLLKNFHKSEGSRKELLKARLQLKEVKLWHEN